MPTVLRGHVKHVAFSCDTHLMGMEEQIENAHHHPVRVRLCDKGKGWHCSKTGHYARLVAGSGVPA